MLTSEFLNPASSTTPYLLLLTRTQAGILLSVVWLCELIVLVWKCQRTGVALKHIGMTVCKYCKLKLEDASNTFLHDLCFLVEENRGPSLIWLFLFPDDLVGISTKTNVG